MQIVDLAEQHEHLYFLCLEDWSDEIKEAGDHKACWYRKFVDRGLHVKLALDDEETVGGMIQYLPVEQSTVEGKDLYLVLCIWVHGYEQGRGNYQKQGMGKAMLQAAEADAKSLGAKGMAAWGLWLPFWMRASWFKRQGYRKADRNGFAVLMWKPFQDDAEKPKWIRKRKTPRRIPGKVSVTAFKNGWCPAQNITFERAKRACAEFGDEVLFQPIDTSDRNVFLEWGISDDLYIDGKLITKGPPPAYEKIKKEIGKRARRL
ncbi:MAG: GNAT family N-acetyltransferase [Pirellulales bacterium]|nr:GNAT family N-acetyltransferase [Pirellulales bacterium]